MLTLRLHRSATSVGRETRPYTFFCCRFSGQATLFHPGSQARNIYRLADNRDEKAYWHPMAQTNGV
jgi:hypothetical protein